MAVNGPHLPEKSVAVLRQDMMVYSKPIAKTMDLDLSRAFAAHECLCTSIFLRPSVIGQPGGRDAASS